MVTVFGFRPPGKRALERPRCGGGACAVSVVWTRYGRPSYDALRAAIAELKRHDPLTPVTVLVPTQLCGVVARRALAAGVAGRTGIAGLSVLTVDRLAEQLAAPALTASGRRPATDAVLAAAWRRVLAEDAGVFAPVADHPATVRALVMAHRELREVDADGLDAIVSSGEAVAAGIVRLHRRVVELLNTDWYDVTDLRRVAAAAVAHQEELGTVVVFQPQDLAAGAGALLTALASARVIAAVGGDR